MASKSNNKTKKAPARTKSIPVRPEEAAVHYELHIAPAQAPHEVSHVPKKSSLAEKLSKTGRIPDSSGRLNNRKNIGNSVWRTLEWLTTSALIFMALFFLMNFGAYSELFKNKLDQLRGEYRLSPYIEKMLQPAANKPTQELLPVAKTPDLGKKQIPSLSLEIAPPDERIIIARINKNVPVVQVKTENLIRRDWAALEKDIQESLKNGVVHYPGTAQIGSHGNVVITGHSSYFPWDPGRFKDVFALLHEVAVGDKIIVYANQQKYIYQIYETKVVTPDKVEVLTQQGGDRLTLITCTPVGTNLKRLIVLAKPV